MRKRKVGRPKGSKNKIRLEKIDLSERYLEIHYKDWFVTGNGSLAHLHELLNQLEGK